MTHCLSAAAKRPPKSKATPNWGGPDPNKHLNCPPTDSYHDDRYHDNTRDDHSNHQADRLVHWIVVPS